MIGHQHMVRAIIADLENHYGASAVLPITSELSRADEGLRLLYQRQAMAQNRQGKTPIVEVRDTGEIR